MSEEKQQTIAEELSAARQAHGLDLEEAQRQTGISLSVLEGMEADQFDMVEPVFVRLALKAYAEFLNLDPEPILSRFDQQQGRIPQPRPRPAVVLEQPKPKRRSRTPLIAIGSVIGVCCLLAVAYYFNGSSRASSQDPAPSAAQTQTAPPQAVQTDVPAQMAVSPTEPLPATALDDSLLVQSSSEPDAAGAPASADTSAMAVAAQTTTAVVLELEARDSTWVQIRWDDAEENFEAIVPPGQRHRFEARNHFVVLSTNPHGLRYWLDGQLLGGGQLGDPTEVLRFRATAAGIELLGSNAQSLTEEALDTQP